MDKKAFLNHFKEYDSNYVAGLYEDIKLCKAIHTPITTKEFITPDIYSKLLLLKKELGVNINSNGIFEECERRILAFTTDKYEFIAYDVKIIRIKNKSKFKKLTHKDYLGALMSLGIRRNVLGDLIVEEDMCYVPVVGDISEYILNNLTTIGKCPCEIEILSEGYGHIPSPKFKESTIICTSLRIDSIVSAVCNISRIKASNMISGGLVLVNYNVYTQKDKVVDIMDTMTIKGYGKYKVHCILGETVKGRIRLVVRKYI